MSVKQKTEVLDSIIEILEYENFLTEDKLEQIVGEVADGFIPVYYTDVVAAWQAMGCPEPDFGGPSGSGVFDLITVALYEVVQAFLEDMVEDSPVDEVLSVLKVERKEFGITEGYNKLAEAILT